jgi:hypothetical protein
MQRMLALEKALSLGHWAVLGRPINGLWAGFLTQWPNWADPNGPAHGPCTGLAWVYVCHEIMFLMWQEILHPVQGVYSLTWLQPDLVTA